MKTLLEDRRVLLPVLLTAVVIAVGSVLIVMLSGGGPDSTATARSPGSAVSASGAMTIDITNFKFLPAAVTVRAGTKVTWLNNDAAPHTATAKGPGGFDTGNLTKGHRRAIVLSTPGTYAYICEIHPFMHATVVVR
jgi:plastocyanin